MCPMCIGTATLVLSGGGTAGGAALVAGYLARKKRRFREILARGLERVGKRPARGTGEDRTRLS